MSFPDTPARSSRRNWFIAAGIGVAVLAAAGVTALVMRNGSDSPAAVTAGETSTPSSATAAATPPTTAAATAAAPATHKVGDRITGSLFTATVYAYRQPTAKNATAPEQAGYEWGSADVEVCPTIDGTITRERWHLVYADHTVIEPSNIGYQQFQKPEYPWDDRAVTAGRCVRGWITYGVPTGARPVMVEYTPEGSVVDWVVS